MTEGQGMTVEKRERMKDLMVEEIRTMTDDDRLEAEFESFFGDSADEILDQAAQT